MTKLEVIDIWTGRRACALQSALRMSNHAFARHLGVNIRTVAGWHDNPDVRPRPEMQESLDTVYESASAGVLARFRVFLAQAPTAEALTPSPSLAVHGAGEYDIDAILSQLTETAVRNDAIEQIERAAACLADSHTQAPARSILSQVLPLHHRVQALLGGRLRLSQQRELYRIESLLLSHACLLLGDLDENALAEQYGETALAYAREAGADPSAPMTVLAKTFRWQDRLTESMDMAHRGYECSPNTPIRIQLASQEANAAALLGDAARARRSLARAEQSAESVAQDSGLSAWSFPTPRQAVFAQSVATQIGDAGGMLRAASVADAAWSAGAPKVAANWAQIHVGAGLAYLMKDSLDGAIAEVEPVLTLPASMRVATVTAYTKRLSRQLQHPRYHGAVGVRELRERLAQFDAEALQEEKS